jgi:hypothetical protein
LHDLRLHRRLVKFGRLVKRRVEFGRLVKLRRRIPGLGYELPSRLRGNRWPMSHDR